MIKHILVPVDGTPLDERALSAAFDLARLFTGHVDVLHVRSDPRQDIRLMGEGVNAEMIERIIGEAERGARQSAKNARHAFDHAVSVAAADLAGQPGEGERVTAWWREVTGRPDQMLGREGRFADLILFAQAAGDPSRTPVLEATLFEAGRPLLLATAGTANDAFRSIAIGWDGSLPAVRAVGGALPFLRRAAAVTILTVDEGIGNGGPVPANADRLVEHLSWHGISAAVRPTPRQGRPVGDTLAAGAADLGAGLLVMGAYGHSRWREMILGGVTHHMLGTPLACSVLMVH